MWGGKFCFLAVITISSVAFVSGIIFFSYKIISATFYNTTNYDSNVLPGQCTNYKLKSNHYKRSSGYQLTVTDVAISDNFLSEGWYRFQSGAGNDMVTSKPSIAMCGTLYPVWLNGKVNVEITVLGFSMFVL